MLRKTMIVLATAAALTGGLTALVLLAIGIMPHHGAAHAVPSRGRRCRWALARGRGQRMTRPI